MIHHTATPWISDGYNVRRPSGRHIAYTGPHHTPANEYPASCRLEDEANAKQIVKAVNCHDDLVAALAHLLTWEPREKGHDDERLAWGKACAVLAKAKQTNQLSPT